MLDSRFANFLAYSDRDSATISSGMYSYAGFPIVHSEFNMLFTVGSEVAKFLI